MLAHYINKARRMSAREFLQKSSHFVGSRLARKRLKLQDKHRSTYTRNRELAIQPVLYEGLDECNVPEYSCEVADFYMRHCFDLLGSGWVYNGFGERYAGCEGYRYDMQVHAEVDREGAWLREILPTNCWQDAKEIWQQVSADYSPIDWQVDFKSGYRWSAKCWYMDTEYGHKPGVDVKVPWELARMQHLIQYVYAYMLAEDREKGKYVQEFQDEILDFIAQNPPRYGVNWRCTMDVGIRVANWLMAYDLFCSLGVRFSDEFNGILAESVYDHGLHIIHNLEYSPQLTHNHYLSDIGGLLFAAMHLASSSETDAWLFFAVQELAMEMKKQFHADGSNFEASTSYHCLSTEIMLHSAMLCRHIPVARRERLKKCQNGLIKGEPGLRKYDGQLFDLDKDEIFTADFWQRLCRALEFVADVSDEHGCIEQIGDADSGRFMKLEPVFHVATGNELRMMYQNLKHVLLDAGRSYYDEDLCNHSHLVRALTYLTSGREADSLHSVEKKLICQKAPLNTCSKALLENMQANRRGIVDKASVRSEWEMLAARLPEGYSKVEYEFLSADDLLSGLAVKAYTGMGIYVYRSEHMKLIVRCGEVGQNGNGGHSHNDQLSVCISIAGRKIVQDCGSYLYTPFPAMRNKFRSVSMHFTPQAAGREQNPWEPGASGLFSLLEDRARGEVVYCGTDGIIMVHDGFGDTVYRVVKIEAHKIYVVDYGKNIQRWARPDFWSNGYGKLIECKSDSNFP